VACARSSTDRASDYGSEGLGFESLRARHTESQEVPPLTCGFASWAAGSQAASIPAMLTICYSGWFRQGGGEGVTEAVGAAADHPRVGGGECLRIEVGWNGMGVGLFAG
jgi:hypothetical protein